jgi:hypothetical protein
MKKSRSKYLYYKNSSQVIEYLRSLAACAVKTHKNKPGEMAKSLKAIPKHAMGMHEECPDWCKKGSLDSEVKQTSQYHDGPIDEKGSLTFDKNLKLIEEPFATLAAKSHELSPNGTTQGRKK